MPKIMRACLVALAAGLLPAAALAQSCNTADRSVLLILDASGSMNAKLPNGETRIAVAQRAIKGVAGLHSRAGAAIVAHVRRAVGGEPEELPGHPSRRAVRRRERERRRDHGIGRRRESARLHADRLFARAGRERFSGRRQGARHRARQRRQGDLPGRSGGGGEGARRQGHHRSHRRLRRRHRRARAAAGHRARHRRHLFRRAGRAGIAGHAEVGAQRLQEAGRHAAAEAAARQAAHDVRDLAHVARRAQRRDRPAGRHARQREEGADASRGHLRGEVRTGELEGHRGSRRRDHHDRAGGAEDRDPRAQNGSTSGRRRFRNRREAWQLRRRVEVGDPDARRLRPAVLEKPVALRQGRRRQDHHAAAGRGRPRCPA